MKVSEITGDELLYDIQERDSYIARFLAALQEDDIDEPVLDIHREIRHRHDLYRAVFEQLSATQRRIIHDVTIRDYAKRYAPITHEDPDRASRRR